MYEETEKLFDSLGIEHEQMFCNFYISPLGIYKQERLIELLLNSGYTLILEKINGRYELTDGIGTFNTSKECFDDALADILMQILQEDNKNIKEDVIKILKGNY